MRVAILGSGSRGNAVVVDAAEGSVLLDAGFSCRQLELRLAQLGVDAKDLKALVLTHEHADHGRGAALLARRYGLTTYATVGTLSAMGLASPTVAVRSGVPVEIGGFLIEPFAIPHDAREPVGFVVEDRHGARLGLAGDMGSRSQLAWARLAELDLLILETNHDLEMLRSGPYPWSLKQRVAGRHGHLSNREAAEGVPELVCDRLRHVVLYHLSQTNNLPALAAATVDEALALIGSRAETVLTEQDQVTPWLEVSP
jgi:phosphoribosyl 1,2-cyclic phosphodiesterase